MYLWDVGSQTTSTGLGCIRCGWETAPTGPGENIELPNYFLKPHLGRKTHINIISGKAEICFRLDDATEA